MMRSKLDVNGSSSLHLLIFLIFIAFFESSSKISVTTRNPQKKSNMTDEIIIISISVIELKKDAIIIDYQYDDDDYYY